jgi:D-glycero-D-manno-heptose 1,7-bisphosphate phosphatase
MKLAFLDKDGTIVKPIGTTKFVQVPSDQELIEGAEAAIASLTSDGYELVIVSNQGGVAAGHKSLESAIEEMRYAMLLTGIETAYFCPDFEGDECYVVTADDSEALHETCISDGLGDFRKPGPGMLKIAAYRFFEEYLDFDNCLMIGDRPEDEQAAAGIGVPFQWASDWRGGKQAANESSEVCTKRLKAG